MALNTFQAGMPSVDLKPGIVMIEFFRQPVVKSVAPAAIIDFGYFKLFIMNILMAVFAILPRKGKNMEAIF